MLNIVIICKDLVYSRYLINFLNYENNNLKVLGVLNEIEELFDISKRSVIDIILINSDCIDYEFLKSNKKIQPYLKSTILILNKIWKNKLNVYAYINNKNDIETLASSINQLATSKIIEKNFYQNSAKKNILIKAIEAELKDLNIALSYTGIKYIIESIYIIYSLEKCYNFNLEKDIYPIIAQKYHKIVSTIKSNITYAVNMMYVECEENKLLEYLKEYSLRKPSPKRIISDILENVKNNTNVYI